MLNRKQLTVKLDEKSLKLVEQLQSGEIPHIFTKLMDGTQRFVLKERVKAFKYIGHDVDILSVFYYPGSQAISVVIEEF